MAQIRFSHVNCRYGDHVLLDDANFAIERRDRVAIIGRNGAGKSTLLKLIQKKIQPDSGEVQIQQGLKITEMPQTVPQHVTGTIRDFLATGTTVESYAIDRALSQLQLDPTILLENASGGMIRRTLLAKALVEDPDVLLLDEPTNHLDIASIQWLESFLLNYHKTIIFITHDRTFMNALATRIFEIDIGYLTCWQDSYELFLKNKEIQLAGKEHANAVFDKKLAQEEKWIRQGIKARRTRNEGRVRALKKMREERAERRDRLGTFAVSKQALAPASEQMFEVNHLHVEFAGKTIIQDFSTIIRRKDKIGIIGPNGSGKSTLIKALLKQLLPTSGEIKHGAQLQVAYFDQHREELDLNLTACENVAGGKEEVVINGKGKHVISYLREFLFTGEKARTLVRSFSGGERNRLLLAKIIAKPSNVLILDEPTNDLDVETLEFLEEFLLGYDGALIVVSHDRTLLNNVVTSTIVFEGDGVVNEYVGGYDDWLRQRKATPSKAASAVEKSIKPVAESAVENKTAKKKLSYNEQRELAQLPAKIEQLEAEIAATQTAMLQPDFYKNKEQAARQLAVLKQKEIELEQAYARWEELEG